MKCLICKKNIRIKKNFENLFSNKKYYICNQCYTNYPISFNYQIFEENNNKVHWFSMFEEEYKIDYNAFILEYSQLFYFILKKLSQNDYFLIFESYKEYKKKSHILPKLEVGEIFLLTYY